MRAKRCRSSCECNEVRQRRGAARRSKRYGEAGSVETDGTARRGEERETRDCRADNGGWLPAQSTRCQRVDIREGGKGSCGRRACACARMRDDDFFLRGVRCASTEEKRGGKKKIK